MSFPYLDLMIKRNNLSSIQLHKISNEDSFYSIQIIIEIKIIITNNLRRKKTNLFILFFRNRKKKKKVVFN